MREVPRPWRTDRDGAPRYAEPGHIPVATITCDDPEAAARFGDPTGPLIIAHIYGPHCRSVAAQIVDQHNAAIEALISGPQS